MLPFPRASILYREDANHGNALQNQHYRFTTLNDELQAHKIDNLVLSGLVTNACVRGTSMDGIKLGYNVTLLSDATESTTQQTKDRAIAELEAFGVYVMTTAEWEEQNKV